MKILNYDTLSVRRCSNKNCNCYVKEVVHFRVLVLEDEEIFNAIQCSVCGHMEMRGRYVREKIDQK